MRAILKLIGFVFSLPIILAAISFAISNVDPIALRLWPFETEVSLPVALAVFIVLVFGFLIGAIAAFIGAGGLRRRLRNAEYRLRQMEMESARMKREQEAVIAKTRESSTALTKRVDPPSLPPALAAE